MPGVWTLIYFSITMEIFILLIILLLLEHYNNISSRGPISYENKNKPKEPPPLKLKRTDDKDE